MMNRVHDLGDLSWKIRNPLRFVESGMTGAVKDAVRIEVDVR
jgi:hypothetical protein